MSEIFQLFWLAQGIVFKLFQTEEYCFQTACWRTFTWSPASFPASCSGVGSTHCSAAAALQLRLLGLEKPHRGAHQCAELPEGWCEEQGTKPGSFQRCPGHNKGYTTSGLQEAVGALCDHVANCTGTGCPERLQGLVLTDIHSHVGTAPSHLLGVPCLGWAQNHQPRGSFLRLSLPAILF